MDRLERFTGSISYSLCPINVSRNSTQSRARVRPPLHRTPVRQKPPPSSDDACAAAPHLAKLGYFTPCRAANLIPERPLHSKASSNASRWTSCVRTRPWRSVFKTTDSGLIDVLRNTYGTYAISWIEIARVRLPNFPRIKNWECWGKPLGDVMKASGWRMREGRGVDMSGPLKHEREIWARYSLVIANQMMRQYTVVPTPIAMP
jgi:hypothetical protein